MARVCAAADVVITAAQVFGKKAPRIITEDIIRGMSQGSLLVDLAVESGGNVAGSQPDKDVEMNGVRIIGLANLPGKVAINASQMFSSNLCALIDAFWNQEEERFILDFADEIIKGCVITHKGKIVNQVIADHYGKITNDS